MRQVEISIDLRDLVNAGIYESEEKAAYEALMLLLKERPEYRKKLAVYKYKNEDISLAKASEIAGVSPETMKWILVENGVDPRLGPENFEEAERECINVRKILKNRYRSPYPDIDSYYKSKIR
ncbi:MAG: UPF0175 family protein [Candidatus Poribacteria bacterium]